MAVIGTKIRSLNLALVSVLPSIRAATITLCCVVIGSWLASHAIVVDLPVLTAPGLGNAAEHGHAEHGHAEHGHAERESGHLHMHAGVGRGGAFVHRHGVTHAHQPQPDRDIAGQDIAGQDIAGQDIAGQDIAGQDIAGQDADTDAAHDHQHSNGVTARTAEPTGPQRDPGPHESGRTLVCLVASHTIVQRSMQLGATGFAFTRLRHALSTATRSNATRSWDCASMAWHRRMVLAAAGFGVWRWPASRVAVLTYAQRIRI